MNKNSLPLEQRIASLRDGEVTDYGKPIGSRPLFTQPIKRPKDDIVDRLITLFWEMKEEGRVHSKNIIADAIDEIERLRVFLLEEDEKPAAPFSLDNVRRRRSPLGTIYQMLTSRKGF
jgi:hypothetical protein